MAKRKKILVLCDAPTIKTGLSRVGRELANRFHRDNYEVYYAGWFHNPLPHEYPFYICQVIRNHSDESGWIRTLIRKTKPDIFLAIGDIWYFDYCSGIFEQLKKEGIEIPERWLYLTLDAEPFFPDWMGIIKAFTKVYPQSQFAVNEIQKVDPYFSGKAVWLGVDKKTFYPMAEKPKWKDKFVVMVNGYNCSRKNIPASLKAFAKFAYDKEDVLLFINSQLNTHVGTDLKRQIFQYGIQFKTVFDKDKSDNKEVPDSTVNTYYNSADCLLITTTGEGFCCLPNTKIQTINGLRDIVSLVAGDEVLTHTGSFQKIQKTMNRNYSGDVISILPYCYGVPVNLTPEHPVLIMPRKKERFSENDFSITNWVKASDIKRGDIVCFPRVKETNEVDFLLMSDIVNNGVLKGDYYYPRGRNANGEPFATKIKNRVNNKVFTNRYFYRLAGWFISKGCATNNGAIAFCFHTNEKKYQAEVVRLMSKIFGLKKHRIVNNSRNRTTVWFQSTVVAGFLRELFGVGARNKKIPNFMLNSANHRLYNLMCTLWSGDGCSELDKRTGSNSFSYSTISEQLANSVFLILARLGIKASFRNVKTRGYKVNVSSNNMFLVNQRRGRKAINKTQKKHMCYSNMGENFYFLIVREVKRIPYEGKVYNLEVENDNTYVANGITIHNCLPILEAFSTKTLVLATDYTTTDELIGKDRGIKLKVAEYFTGEYELQRALVDVDDTVEKLNFVYADWKNGKPEAKKLTENAYDFVQDLTWEKTYRDILSKPKAEEWKTF